MCRRMWGKEIVWVWLLKKYGGWWFSWLYFLPILISRADREYTRVTMKAISCLDESEDTSRSRYGDAHHHQPDHPKTSHPTLKLDLSRLKPSQTLSICLARVSHHVSLCVTDTCLFQAWAHSPSTVSVHSRWHIPHQHPNCHAANWHSSQPKGSVTHRANTLLHSTAKMRWHKQVTAMGMSSGQSPRPTKWEMAQKRDRASFLFV